MKRVLITGANSFVGVSFENYVKEHYCYELSIETLDMLDDCWKEKDFSVYDIVFHVAGIAHVDVSKISELVKEKYYAVNTSLAIEVANKAKREGVTQFVLMSSAIVYGDSAPFGKIKIITKESNPEPSNFYGDSKWRADVEIRKLSTDEFLVAVLRAPMIYGNGSKGNYVMLTKMARRLPLFPDVQNERSMLYIENLCEFLAQVMIRGERGVFWPQNAEYCSTSKLVAMIAEFHGHRILISKAFNWMVKVMSILPGRIKSMTNKAFGNLTYEQEMSKYEFEYQLVDLKESIRRTEGENKGSWESPCVSVIMATYNDKPSYLDNAISSILSQSFTDFELLILDDSTDLETSAIIDKYSVDSRVHILREDHKLGFVSSLNKGLNLAKGDYIARMDGDDIADILRLEKQVLYLKSHASIDILGGQINVIDENGRVTGVRSYPLGGLKLLAFFTLRTPVAHPSVMFRRSIVDAGYRYDETFQKAEDIDFWIRLYNAGYKFGNLSDTLVDFRVESNFVEKRVSNHAQEEYVLLARRKNFTWRKPIFSVIDLAMSYVRQWTPDSLKTRQYEQENGNKK